jgi:hypothetical protein
MSKADVYRNRAAECQHLADAAVLASARKTLQEIADKYQALAANEDRCAAMVARAGEGGSGASVTASRSH